MASYLKKFTKFISSPSHQRTRTILIVLLIALAIPLTIAAVQKQQTLNQHAASCLPRPSCLDANPACLIPEPAGGWCPTPITPLPTAVPSIFPRITCVPKPKCLDSTPRCLVAEPKDGWCAVNPTPTIMDCPKVTTPAKNPYSGQCLNFSSPCRVPLGWTKVTSCVK